MGKDAFSMNDILCVLRNHPQSSNNGAVVETLLGGMLKSLRAKNVRNFSFILLLLPCAKTGLNVATNRDSTSSI